ncbi:DHA2 family efflux MFS transporter permease subunit [Gordonia humi]|uniref:EmrB/QacA subfamily drug resistance transporter n=1 Tax=Gordonia humi TaxID=686429 RepID=A0A840F268_9ACTN|nr:DHA2 family efflux MFS transporter permease subunit [Gordonia humi]MBB4135489.1 EmrB/QacA subfamily drug resistance transporter [Gordonia humi]
MATKTVNDVPVEAKRVAFAVVAGLTAPILDTTIVTIAFDELTRTFDAGVGTVQWTGTAYLLALAVAVPLAGWVATRFGSRRAWQAGLMLFLLGSILCASAWNLHALIAFRVVQGLGAGLLFPLMTSILVAASGGRALGRLVAMVSLPTALGPILGPVVGGVILHWLNWHWMFLVNIPVCLVALVMSWRIPDDRRPDAPRLDWIGLLLMAPGLAGLLLGLSNASAGIARADVLVPFAVGVVLLGVFAWRSGRGASLVDVGILRLRNVAASSAGLFFFSLASFGAMLALPLYFQQVRGESVLGAALILIPQGVGALASRMLAGRLTDSMGARWVAVAGFAVVAVATVPFACADETTGFVWLGVWLLVRGLGLGMLLSPVMASAFVGLAGEKRHDASIVSRAFQQVGGSVGTAVAAVVITAGVTATAGFRDAFWWMTALAVVGGLAALWLPGVEKSSAL